MITKKYFSSLFLVVLMGIGLFANSSQANNSWGGYHWARTINPFFLKIGDNVSSNWDPYLNVAAADWSLSSVLDTTVVLGTTNPKNCRAVSGRVEVCNSKYGNTGWLGIASISVNATHITQGTVKFNDTYFETAKYNTPAWRTLVTCQEIGHTLGLDHQDEVSTNPNLGTCMDYTNDPDGLLYGQLSNEHPNNHDYDELAQIYSHIDAVTTIKQLLLSSNQEVDHSDTSTWGKEIRTSDDKKSSVYERNFGNGNKVFTFVTWAK